LKQKIFTEQLGGNRREVWYRIRNLKLGFVSKDETEHSSLSNEEVTELMKAKKAFGS
jgi:ATP-dependent DNA helicase 2 subunit 2